MRRSVSWNWLGKVPLASIVAGVYLFLYMPLVALVIFSFNKEPFPAPWSGWTLHWFWELWQDEVVWSAMQVSFGVALSATLLSLSMGLGLIYWRLHATSTLHEQQQTTNWLGYLFFPNIIVPELVIAVALLNFFVALQITFGLVTLVIGHTLLGMGYAIPLLLQRYADIDYRLIEASLDLGASRTQTFIRVIVPLLKDSLIASALLIFIVSFDDFIVSYFCAGADVQTVSLYLLAMLRTGFSPVMTAFATMLVGLSTLLVALWCWYSFSKQQDAL